MKTKFFSFKIRNKTRMTVYNITYIPRCIEDLSHSSRMKTKGVKMGKEEIKLSFTNDVIMFTKNPNESVDKLLDKSLTRPMDRIQ